MFDTKLSFLSLGSHARTLSPQLQPGPGGEAEFRSWSTPKNKLWLELLPLSTVAPSLEGHVSLLIKKKREVRKNMPCLHVSCNRNVK